MTVMVTVNWTDNTRAKNLYIMSVKGIKGRLNMLLSTRVNDTIMANINKVVIQVAELEHGLSRDQDWDGVASNRELVVELGVLEFRHF